MTTFLTRAAVIRVIVVIAAASAVKEAKMLVTAVDLLWIKDLKMGVEVHHDNEFASTATDEAVLRQSREIACTRPHHAQESPCVILVDLLLLRLISSPASSAVGWAVSVRTSYMVHYGSLAHDHYCDSCSCYNHLYCY